MAEGPEQHREVTGAEVYDFFSGLFKRFIAGVLSTEDHACRREHFKRLWIGGAGGFFYTCIKNYFGAGIGIYGIWTMDPTSPRREELMFGYVSAYFVSILLGGVTAWLSAQKSGRLLFLIGMFGVQILLTILPGLQSKSDGRVGWLIDEMRPVAPAYAQDQTEAKCVGDSAFLKGFKAAFGVRDQYNRFAVVVASGKSADDAQAKLKTLSVKDPSLKLYVGPRACDNDYYPVFASDYLPLDDAKTVLDKMRQSLGVPDAYLTPGPLYSN